MRKIVLFASGNGSNAENIMAHFEKSGQGTVVGVFTNNSHAKVIERAKKFHVKSLFFQLITTINRLNFTQKYKFL